jgi:hypothetical protein
VAEAGLDAEPANPQYRTAMGSGGCPLFRRLSSRKSCGLWLLPAIGRAL